MICKAIKGDSATNAVAYNENKVEKGQATRIPNFESLNPNRLSVTKSINDQEQYYRGRSKNTCVHAVLAFTETDRQLPHKDLQQIVAKYMDRVGYGGQPFQAYEHLDKEGHQHLHIVTTRVQDNGKLISDSNNFFKNKKVARDLEKEFALVVVPSIKDPTVKKVLTGIALKMNAAVSQVVAQATDFTSLKVLLKPLGVDFKVLPKIRGKQLDTPGITFFLKDNGKKRSRGLGGAKIDFKYADLATLLESNKVTRNISTPAVTPVAPAVPAAALVPVDRSAQFREIKKNIWEYNPKAGNSPLQEVQRSIDRILTANPTADPKMYDFNADELKELTASAERNIKFNAADPDDDEISAVKRTAGKKIT